MEIHSELSQTTPQTSPATLEWNLPGPVIFSKSFTSWWQLLVAEIFILEWREVFRESLGIWLRMVPNDSRDTSRHSRMKISATSKFLKIFYQLVTVMTVYLNFGEQTSIPMNLFWFNFLKDSDWRSVSATHSLGAALSLSRTHLPQKLFVGSASATAHMMFFAWSFERCSFAWNIAV